MAKAGNTILLDLTDLFFGIGSGPMTGINRVGFAYLQMLCSDTEIPALGFVHHGRGALLLDREGMAWVKERLEGHQPWPETTLRARLRTDLPEIRQRAYAGIRAQAIESAHALAIAPMLRRAAPGSGKVVVTGLRRLHRGALKAFLDGGFQPVVKVHDTIPLDFPDYVPKGGYRWFEERLAAVGELAALTLYNSEQTQADAERHFARLGRVPPGLTAHLGVTALAPDPSQTPSTVASDRPVFVTVGTIEPRKNHALLLDIWDRLRESRPARMPQLVIIGNRGWRNEAVHERLDAAAGGGDIVELQGLPDGAMAALIQRASALLFPSHCEGFGLPAIEAAQLGTPVICNDLPVFGEYLGNYPLMIPANDPERWQREIEAHANGQAPPRPVPPPLPTWDAYFAKVLPRLEQLEIP
ncbi:MAG: glycosyltransferase family 1 protein [Pseudomonadota bacterium]